MLRAFPAVLLAAALTCVPSAGRAHADQVRDEMEPVLASLDVPRAWAASRGRGVTVAVLDSGVDASQADLAGSVVTGPDYAAGAAPDGTVPKRLHGTNMASIIAGHGHGPGGADGMVGVAPEARVLALRVILERDEPGYETFGGDKRYEGTIARGIRYAADHGADVINLSLGRAYPLPAERDAVAHAVSKGVVVVAAAGNGGAGRPARTDGHPPYTYPASFPGVISVAAVDADGRHAGFSNRNSAVVVSAPGVRIVGAGPDGRYWVGDGTSPATAFVSGIAALIRSRHPGMAPALVAQALVESARSRPSGGYDLGIGFGRVNAAAALDASDRLAGARTSGLGVDPARAVGVRPPVRVVRHPTSLVVGGAVAGLLALVGLILSVITLRRRPNPEFDHSVD
ncbi:S8 family serine peptidase [Actinomadura oligospora]|uniref:S8 family serine peptidase n=1 Tax=Actinomadura oligospora TaxID=111804 RepID=UPI00047CB1F0|nr:S8 family serine peptidase [Actinomadura oligospora]